MVVSEKRHPAYNATVSPCSTDDALGNSDRFIARRIDQCLMVCTYDTNQLEIFLPLCLASLWMLKSVPPQLSCLGSRFEVEPFPVLRIGGATVG